MRQTHVQVSHDPFARVTLYRRVILRATPQDAKAFPLSCRWCGSNARFEYCAHGDDRTSPPLAFCGPFCSVPCYRTYTENR